MWPCWRIESRDDVTSYNSRYPFVNLVKRTKPFDVDKIHPRICAVDNNKIAVRNDDYRFDSEFVFLLKRKRKP